MIADAFVVAIMLIQLTDPTGQRIDINTRQITSVREPTGAKEHWAKGTRCIIVMTNGRFIAVSEECGEVRSKLTGALPGRPCTMVCGGVQTP